MLFFRSIFFARDRTLLCAQSAIDQLQCSRKIMYHAYDRAKHMCLLCNMATGKRLAVIFPPKAINLFGNNKLNKFSYIVLQQCNTCRRYVSSVAPTVNGWNRDRVKKSKCGVLQLYYITFEKISFPMFLPAFQSKLFDFCTNYVDF